MQRRMIIKTLAVSTIFTVISGCTDSDVVTEKDVKSAVSATYSTGNGINPNKWPEIAKRPLNSKVEQRVDALIAKMSLEQKVGQILQADSNAVTPEEVKSYRLGSVLSGGNSAPGGLPYAGTDAWLEAADAYYEASVDSEGVEVAIPVIWGIDAVHGHTNLSGAVIFPHNIGLGAARAPDLIKRIAEITAVELNVSGHDWTFAPTLAVPQNDRWGRSYEGFSESPDIVKSYGGVIAEGLQGKAGTEGFMQAGRVISTAKHFIADGGTKNGVDKGDTQTSEDELIETHLAGYLTAIESGSQSVMASFSSWQGQPMHGQKELLTDVLKGRMNFDGFVIGDWNGHALIPGCTATDCPQAFNAGIDMFMAPDSWKGLYESTLRHVKSGEIPMARLDDAVRRILRVKVNSGIFEKAKPSARDLAGKEALLGSKAHRDVAREAVRKSLVLLKNNDKVLPLKPSSKVHIIGRGADSISKLSGGWTLSWQGGGYPNDKFPNAQTFLEAVKQTVEAAGGRVTYDASGAQPTPDNTDVVIAVYGEDPYAEFKGDIDNVDFTPNDLDPSLLATHKAAGASIVSVFLSGRPLWTNPEINLSDVFIAAWLPGSESGGIADVIFKTKPDYDFTGKLSFSWPALATQALLNPQHADYNPLFPLGYGLTYSTSVVVPQLAEESGLTEDSPSSKRVFFKGSVNEGPWRVTVNGENVSQRFKSTSLELQGYDHKAQEDALRIDMIKAGEVFAISSQYGHDFEAETNAGMEISFYSKRLSGASSVEFSLGCAELKSCHYRALPLSDDWTESRIPIKCFESKGVTLNNVQHIFSIKNNAASELVISNVVLKPESKNSLQCE